MLIQRSMQNLLKTWVKKKDIWRHRTLKNEKRAKVVEIFTGPCLPVSVPILTNDNRAADRGGRVMEPLFPECTALLAHIIAPRGIDIRPAARHRGLGHTQRRGSAWGGKQARWGEAASPRRWPRSSPTLLPRNRAPAWNEPLPGQPPQLFPVAVDSALANPLLA